MKNSLRLFALAGLTLLTSCSNDTFPVYVALGNLRVLGIIACSPEISPGGSTKMHAIISDITSGGTRTLTETWESCTDPGVSAGAEPTCVGVSDRTVVYSGTVSTLSSPYYTARGTAVTVTAPSTILSGRTDQVKFNGYPFLVTYTLTASNGDQVRAFKRVLVTDASVKGTKNAAPQLSGIKKSGGTLSSTPYSSGNLNASFVGGSAETYLYKITDTVITSQTEDLTSTWFVSEGSFKYYRTVSDDTNAWTPPASQPSGRQVVTVVIARDSRGGEDATSLPTSLVGSPSVVQAACP